MKAILMFSTCLCLALSGYAQNVVQVEYFIDTDAGVGRNRTLNVAASPGGEFPVSVDLSGLSAGSHLLYMRTRDDAGVWSQVARKHIEVLPLLSGNVLVAGEYFFDLDPGFGAGNPIIVSAQDSLIYQEFNSVVSGLSPGPHKLYIRVRDAYGKWSKSVRSTIEVDPAASHHLVQGEYYFDADPGFGKGTGLAVSPEDSLVTQQFIATTTGLLPGQHVLYERLKDSYGKWSQTKRRLIDVVKNPDTNFIVTLEYFFNNDPGVGNAGNTPLTTLLQNGEFAFTIPLNELPGGRDTLFIRARDSSDYNWSHTTWRVPVESPLPLSLLNFAATIEGHSVDLHWQTENEFNTAFFNVQRSTDGFRFINAGRVSAKGNSIAKSSYNYVDDVSTLRTDQLYYRLEQADIDGTVTYSNIVSVGLKSGNATFRVMPNPATDYIMVTFGRGLVREKATIMISDLAGHTLLKQPLNNDASQKIHLPSFAKGVYVISLISHGKIQSQRLTIR